MSFVAYTKLSYLFLPLKHAPKTVVYRDSGYQQHWFGQHVTNCLLVKVCLMFWTFCKSISVLIHSAHGKGCTSADVQSMLDVTAALMQTVIFLLSCLV